MQPQNKLTTIPRLEDALYEFEVTGLAGDESSCRIVAHGFNTFHELHLTLYQALRFRQDSLYEFLLAPLPLRRRSNPGAVAFTDPHLHQELIGYLDTIAGRLPHVHGTLYLDASEVPLCQSTLTRGRTLRYTYGDDLYSYRLRLARITPHPPGAPFKRILSVNVSKHRTREKQWAQIDLGSGKVTTIPPVATPVRDKGRPYIAHELITAWVEHHKGASVFDPEAIPFTFPRRVVTDGGARAQALSTTLAEDNSSPEPPPTAAA